MPAPRIPFAVLLLAAVGCGRSEVYEVTPLNGVDRQALTGADEQSVCAVYPRCE